MRNAILCAMACGTPLATCAAARADEGMWLFNDLPNAYLKQKYDFEPTDAWARHVMRSSVRFNSGGSGSFVSSTGLVITNHHVGADTLYKVSTAEHNYHRDGFYATSQADEIKAPDLELNRLISIEDVTERVKAAVKPGMSAADAFAARRAVMAEIENESFESTGLRSDVITLYQGGRYHLYRYKRYTDVRLVFAPEVDIAFFGGDPDNFEYPRYCLDICIMRVYEDDRPAQIDDFLEWNAAGAGDDELVFVSGNPGRTSRLYTVAAFEFLRDVVVPFRLGNYRRREINLQQYGHEGEEQARRARDDLFGVENSRKALTGMLAGLQDPALIAQKRADETALLKQIRSNDKLTSYAPAWDQIAAVQTRYGEIYVPYTLLERGLAFDSQLFAIARTLVRMAAEDQKPSPERLREYRDSARDSLEQRLFSEAPVYDDLETAKLTDSLSMLTEQLGADDPLVVGVLDGDGPSTRAAALVSGTRLGDVAVRRRLAEGGASAIAASDDPLIALARLVDPPARDVRTRYEETVEEPERQAYAQIAEAQFATHGTAMYPDATFTLRLAFGQVKGYLENGRAIPPWTTMGGAFEHEVKHGGQPPWQLPDSWHEARGRINAETPMNFVSTADIIGGNSGSPVIDREARFVGIIFDGNIQSLTSDYLYSDEVARAVSVHAGAITEALRKVYGADGLASELGK